MTIINPKGAYGYTDLQTTVFSVPAQFEASAAVTANRVVSIGTDGSVATAATDAPSLAVGVAREALTTGYTGVVTVFGLAENVPAAGAITAGAIVKASATTAGFVSATATPAVGEALGVAIAASASNTVDIWVCKAV